jgi:dienelactone hydrolase
MWRAALIVAAVSWMSPAIADEAVQLDAARYRIGELQQRLAHERGQTLQRPPAQMVTGYLSKPAGEGPFAAVVYLHGCLGLSDFRRHSTAAQFTGWGYVTLVVDSFATRGIKDDCLGQPDNRPGDALGALLYLSKLPFVDPKRIAVVGSSKGGIAVLELATAHKEAIFEMPPGVRYKAAVAFYPSCSAAGNEIAMPVLVLIGALDDWSRASECGWWAKRRDAGAPVKVNIYPEAYHSFDNPNLRVATRAYGHWMKYDADATAKATAAVRDFLATQLK